MTRIEWFGPGSQPEDGNVVLPGRFAVEVEFRGGITVAIEGTPTDLARSFRHLADVIEATAAEVVRTEQEI